MCVWGGGGGGGGGRVLRSKEREMQKHNRRLTRGREDRDTKTMD